MNLNNYRPEIDGLRAVAVLAVIVFHAGVEALSGGFIGVDIFYVISGYLITRIIVSDLQSNDFTVSSFYVRRIKRLLPAALFLIFMTLLFSLLILSPDKYVELSKSAIASNLFIANIWFLKHSGYFDISTQISPLAHMWSLSVEEQFYLIYPFILIFCYRILGIKGIKIAVIFIIVLSFLLSLNLSFYYPNFSFYMLPTRAWELGLGAIVFLFPLQKKNTILVNILACMGAIFIIYGLISISHYDIYPGYMALAPTIGTALIIYANTSKFNFINLLLSIKPLLFIGKISYSSYLWHWPIVVFYRIYINERAFYPNEVVVLILSSLLMGYLSWRYIEESFRYKTNNSKSIFAYACNVTIVMVIISVSILATKGYPSRVSDDLAAISNKNLMWKWQCVGHIKPFVNIDENFCVVGSVWDKSAVRGIVWGDSHSQHWAQLIHHEAKRQGVSLAILPRKCPAYLNKAYIKSHYPKYPNYTSDCTKRNKLTLDFLNKNDDIKIVVLAAAWSGHVRMMYSDSQPNNKSNVPLEDRSAEIGAKLSEKPLKILLSQLKDKQVLLLADIPRPNKLLNECAFSEKSTLFRNKCDDADYKYLDSHTILSWHRESNNMLTSAANNFDNVTSIIPSNLLCDDNHCRTYINDELIYKDENHIRRNLKTETSIMLSKKIGLNNYFKKISASQL